MPKKKKTPSIPIPIGERSLLCYVQSLVVNRVPVVVVECRDDVVVRGRLVECDESMNVTLENCEVVTIDGETRTHETLFVKNRTVRGIHVPRRFRTCDVIETMREETFQARTFYRRQLVQGKHAGKERLAKGRGGAQTTFVGDADAEDAEQRGV